VNQRVSSKKPKFRGYLPKAAIAAVDAFLVGAALSAAYMIRFDFSLDPFYLEQLLSLLPIFVLIHVSALYYTNSYHFLWRYAGISDLVRVLKAVGLALALLAVANYFRNYPVGMLIAVGFFLSALFHRGVLRLVPRRRHRRSLILAAIGLSSVLLVAGVVVFTVVRSAPQRLADIPFGERLAHLEFRQDLAMPRGVLVMEAILSFVFFGGLRIAPRLFAEVFAVTRTRGKRVLVLGAGDVGEALVRAVQKDAAGEYLLVGFIDDDPTKLRARIHGVPVLGTRADLDRLMVQHRIEELLVTPVSLIPTELREIAATCWQRKVTVRRVAGLSRVIDQDIGIKDLESVDIEELLGRPEVELDPTAVTAYLRDRVVLVTGAGGSIGSELCRQVARCGPDRMVLLGKGENSIYVIENELRAAYPEIDIHGVIADIANPGKMDYVFRTYRPDVVFHAAAYKHVPFMEDNPEESVWNNVFGTRTVAMAAQAHDVGRFVMISTDKAVNPSSMMGASKRVAELVLQQLAGKEGATAFVTVRFGNVLRSRGSVIPLFEKQIEAGGPVTVTHPEMVRYFMSIPEAVRLVLHSGAIGKRGDLCVLDMGEQVKIRELAENMIRMAGKVPDEDIDIVFTGIRPGEKLYEELYTADEARSLQKVDGVFVCRPNPDTSLLEELLPELREAALQCRRADIVDILHRLIPAYESSANTEQMAAGVDSYAAVERRTAEMLRCGTGDRQVGK
jgi:FlaA1/EpsC-like NDP-sugar epimerase